MSLSNSTAGPASSLQVSATRTHAGYEGDATFGWRAARSFAGLRALALAALVVVLVACGDRKIAWTEEVQLSSGEVIVVKRTAVTQQFGEVGGAGGWEAEFMTLEVGRPKQPGDPAPWSFPYVPVLFDRDPASQEWFVVATFYTCERWHELGQPKLPYAEWRYRAGHWQRVGLSPTHVGRAANMLTSIRAKGEPTHTLASKTTIMSDRRIAPKFRRVFDGWQPLGCSKGGPVQQ